MNLDKSALDAYITGNYGEDQFRDEDEPPRCRHTPGDLKCRSVTAVRACDRSLAACKAIGNTARFEAEDDIDAPPIPYVDKLTHIERAEVKRAVSAVAERRGFKNGRRSRSFPGDET